MYKRATFLVFEKCHEHLSATIPVMLFSSFADAKIQFKDVMQEVSKWPIFYDDRLVTNVTSKNKGLVQG